MTSSPKPFWRMDPPILNDQGQVIKGGMWPHQRIFWEAPHFIKALIMGYGGGKTFVHAKRAIWLALRNAPAPHLSVSPSYPQAKRTIIPTLKELLDGKSRLLNGQMRYTYNVTDKEFRITFGGRTGVIWIASGDNPDSLKGPNVGSLGVDEPFIQPVNVFNVGLSRIRDPRAKHREYFLTGTPEDLNWGYELCAPEGELRQKMEKEGKQIFVLHESTKANLALGDFAAMMEAAYSDEACQAYVDGQFVTMKEGRVYYAFDGDNIQDLPDPGHELFVGMDFNVNPMSCVVGWRNGNHLHFIDEFELPNSDTQYACKVVNEKYPGRVKKCYPDASGKARKTSAPGGVSDFHFIREARWSVHAKSTNPPTRDRENSVNGKLRPREGSPTLTFSPKCKKLIRYLKTYCHERKNEKDQKAMSHLIDAMGYPVAYMFPIDRSSTVTRLLGSAY